MNKYFFNKAYIIILLFVSFSCSDERSDLLNLFVESGDITLKKINLRDSSEYIGDPAGICFYKDHIIIPDHSISNDWFAVVDVNESSITHQIARGRGPNELIFTLPLTINYINDCLVSFDTDSKKITYYDLVNSKLKEKKIFHNFPPEKETMLARFVCIDSSKIFFDGIFEEGKYGKGNYKLDNPSFFGTYSQINGIDAPTVGENFMGFQGLMAVRPDSKMVAYSSFQGGVLDFIDLNNEKIERKEFFKPSFRLLSSVMTNWGGRPMKPAVGGRRGFVDLKVTQDFVYVLFSGEERMKEKPNNIRFAGSDILLQFDWKGNPLKKWKFDRVIYSFDINPESNEIYALTKEPTVSLFTGNL